MDRFDIAYDPARMEEYLAAGRKARAHAFGDLMTSLKEMFSKKPEAPDFSGLARPGAPSTC